MFYQIGEYRVLEDVKHWNILCQQVYTLKFGDIVKGIAFINDDATYIDTLYAVSNLYDNAKLEIFNAKAELVREMNQLDENDFYSVQNEYSWALKQEDEISIYELTFKITKDVYTEIFGEEIKSFSAGDVITGRGNFCNKGLLNDLSGPSTLQEILYCSVDEGHYELITIGQCLEKGVLLISENSDVVDISLTDRRI